MSVRSFFGIRYASLENGQRFDLPVPVEAPSDLGRTSPYAQTEDVPIFPQLPSRLSEHMGSPEGRYPQQEDAFYLNVFIPEETGPAPVMIFIHGGAWVSGAGTWNWYNGEALADRGVVVVNVNYRIHASGLLDDGETHLPLEDLKLAIDWVHKNIHHFGGNPNSVTLVGQSAGGWYVHKLSQDPELRGKIHKVALLSMGTRTPWTRSYRDKILEDIAHQNSPRTTSELSPRELMVSALKASVTINERINGPKQIGYAPSALLPTVASNLDPSFLDPDVSAKNLVVDEVFIRFTSQETGIFFATAELERGATHDDADKAFKRWIDPNDEAIIPEHLYTAMLSDDLTPYQRLVAISSWNQFQRLPHQLAHAYRASGVTVQLHEFTFQSPKDGLGAAHCFDLPFQFGQREHWQDSPYLAGVSDRKFEEVSAATIHQLTSFIKA